MSARRPSGPRIQAALNAGAGGLAPLAASLLGGAIYDTLGPEAVFVACACALGLAMLIMLGGDCGWRVRARAEGDKMTR